MSASLHLFVDRSTKTLFDLIAMLNLTHFCLFFSDVNPA